MQDDNAPDAKTYMDCGECKLSEAERATFRCGWMREKDRTGTEGYAPGEYTGKRPDKCCGYLIQLPQVIEAVRANTWREKGALREFYDGNPITDLAKDAMDIFASSQREAENYTFRNRTKEG